MKLFVTGGTGFIGSHFLKEASAAGHLVVAQRRPGSLPRLNLTSQPVWVDRALDQDFKKELEGCDTVVHFASHTPNPPYAPLDECLYWNVYVTSRLLRQAAEQGIKNILIAGTSFEYGTAAQGQIHIHPGTEMRPTTSYSISKAAATTACLGLARELSLNVQVLRIFQAYGEGESASRFWPSLRRAAMEGRDFEMSAGTQIRDFIHVSEVASQFVKALDFPGIELGHPVLRNIGTGQGQSLLEFARYWWSDWKASGTLKVGRLSIRPGEPERLVADVFSEHVT